MPENDRLSGCLDETNVDFVEQEVTPRLLMKLNIQLHLAELSFLNIVLFIEVLVLKELDRLLITGFTRPTYSWNLFAARITLRSMKL